jgi:putative Mg2+ transporter-C (MgtC) family protein
MFGHTEIILRLVAAAVLGAAVGLEREVHGRPAGIRTYLLLSLGSALIMVVSEYLVVEYEPKMLGEALRVDPARIAAQAVTGIGFLGAGVIIRYKDTIRGLTTAACVWVVCAVGLAVGAGFYLFSAVVTSLTIVSLLGLKAFEQRLKKDWYKEITVVSDDMPGQFRRIQDLLDSHGYEVVNFGWKKDLEKKEATANLLLRVRAVQLEREVLQEIFELAGVKRVNLA